MSLVTKDVAKSRLEADEAVKELELRVMNSLLPPYDGTNVYKLTFGELKRSNDSQCDYQQVVQVGAPDGDERSGRFQFPTTIVVEDVTVGLLYNDPSP